METLRALMEDEIPTWLEFVCGMFSLDPHELFHNQWYCDPTRSVENILVAVDEKGSYLSTLRVFEREIYLQGHRVGAAAIGTVGTLEGYRGRGLASRLFQRCLEMLAGRRVPLSYLLCGEHNVPFYERFGYAKAPHVRQVATVRERVSYPCTFSLRDVDLPRDGASQDAASQDAASQDVASLSAMHASFSSRFNGPIVRSIEYWTQWVPSVSAGTYRLAVDGDGQPIAYMNVGECEGRLCVYDFGHAPGHQGIFDAFIRAICDALDKADAEVEYQRVIASRLPVVRLDEMACCRLIAPFAIGGRTITSTGELVAALRGDDEVSELLLWDIDDV